MGNMHNMEEDKTVSTGEWIITYIILCIPFVNAIALLYWLFSSRTNPSKKNWVKATLLMGILFFILSLPVLFVTARMVKSRVIRYSRRVLNEITESYSRSSEITGPSQINRAKLEKAIMQEQNKLHRPETKIEIPEHKGYLIAVYKESHILKLFKDNKVIKQYPVNLRNELADRRIWRDDQTPEGSFRIEDMNIVTNGWSRWMRLNTLEKAKKIYIQSYPDGEKVIKTFEAKHGTIKTDGHIRNFNKANPRQKMLRGIGIHGGGYIPGNDWTVGCVALSDKNVIELYTILSSSKNGGIGTPVLIQD